MKLPHARTLTHSLTHTHTHTHTHSHPLSNRIAREFDCGLSDEDLPNAQNEPFSKADNPVAR